MQLRTFFGVVISASFLSACGGGSDGNDPQPIEAPPPNNAPTLVVADTSVAEGESVVVEASATDSDGSIASFEWTQKSGPTVAFDNGDSTITFTAPAVQEDTELTFEVVVTDDDGDSTEETVTVTITANMREMAISGKVTDGPIANAKVEVTINGETYTTTADANGDYTINISADDSLDDALVTIIAKGPGENSPVKLVSHLDSLTNLVNAAGDDGTLTKDDLFSVNVTNVTTAQAALMEQAHGGKITDVASLEDALKDYDDSLLLTYATAIKLVIDYSTAYPELTLPSELSDTLALVTDPQAAANYFNNAKKSAAEIVDQAQDEIIDDPELVSAGNDRIPLADTYYIIMPDGQFGKARISLDESGTGHFLTHQHEIELSWTQSSTGVDVTFSNSPVHDYSSHDETSGKMIETQEQLVSANIKWLKQTEKADTIVWNETYQVVYPNGEKAPETRESELVLKTVKSRGVLNANETLNVGTYFVEYYKYASIEVRNAFTGEIASEPAYGSYGIAEVELNGTLSDGGTANIIISNVDGTGQITKQNLAGSWSISEAGFINIATNADDYVFDLAVLKRNDDGLLFVNNKHSIDRAGSIGGTSSTALEKSSMSPWTESLAPGIYSLSWDHFAPNDYYWVEVNADGTALTVDVFDENDNGSIEPDEITKMPGFWAILDNGAQLNIRRYKDWTDYCKPSQYTPGFNEECQLQHERTWSSPLISENADGETEYHVAHLHRFYKNYFADYANWTETAENVLWSASFDNRRFIKVSERPFDIDAVLNP
ncbi:PKD domain-containing protein [Alteromonas sp. ASW11-130]|uniref:PKD domain-containing protein n=1 Tax=Alteromonas sp. ASW11-130 TaxID=3015775 RepID=UPI00224291F0|nr:hypothetical protein [Alteromonas sp. ASW11-130]MCW8092023.1 hypothetical protein [Alteromonas sp. ASW11-130]